MTTKQLPAVLGLLMLMALNAAVCTLLAHSPLLYALAIVWTFCASAYYGWKVLGPAFRGPR